MSPFELPCEVVDQAIYENAVSYLRAAEIRLPTFVELADPNSGLPDNQGADNGIDADAPHSENLHRIHWYNNADRTDLAKTPGHLVLTKEVTGVEAPIMAGDSREKIEPQMLEWLNSEWDFPSHSDCTRESAIIGNVDECVEQLQAHLDAGVQKIIFVPYKYQSDQVEVIAKEIIPRLRK